MKMSMIFVREQLICLVMITLLFDKKDKQRQAHEFFRLKR